MEESIKTKIKGTLVYEDAVCFVIVPEKQATAGHLQIFPHASYTDVESIPKDVFVQMFFVASYGATALFEGLKAHGTNIVLRDGKESNGVYDYVYIDVVGRMQNDNVMNLWQPKQLDEATQAQTQARLKEEAFYVGKEIADEKKEIVLDDDQQEAVDEGNNYKIKNFYRMP